MSFENRFDRALEQQRRAENERKANFLESAAAHNTPELSDFADSTEHQQDLQADERYVQYTESRFDEDPSYHAKGLEHFIQFGIAQGRLINDPENNSYLSEPIWVTRYDDLRNRIDTAATIHVFPEASPDGEEHELSFGLDLTTNPSPDVIRRKLLVGSNDPSADYPAGFSRIKYYRDTDGFRSKRTCIPRYCIGISSTGVDDLLDDINIDRSGNIMIRNGAEAVPSFKILYEMSKQNELFETPLYQKEDAETLSDEEEQALRDMEILDNIYLKELTRISAKLPPWATSGCIGKDGKPDIEEIAQKFMSGEDQDETFTSVIATTEDLMQRYENDASDHGNPDPDFLKKAGDRLRKTPAQRNQSFGHAAYKAASRRAG